MPTRFPSFGAKQAHAMGDAFNAALDSLTSHADCKDGAADWVREVLALRIIEMAQAGMTDVEQLRDDALAHLANLRIQNKA